MNNGSVKKLPSKPKVIDGLPCFISIPEIQNEKYRHHQKKTKAKLKRFIFVTIFLFSCGYFFVSTTPIKTQKSKIVKTIAPKKNVLIDLSAPPKRQDPPQINHAETPDQVSADSELAAGDSYEPYEGTNSEFAYDPYMEEVGQYLAHEEEQSL